MEPSDEQFETEALSKPIETDVATNPIGTYAEWKLAHQVVISGGRGIFYTLVWHFGAN